jgi:hypothetical protein
MRANISGRRLNTDVLVLRLSKLFHIWYQSMRLLVKLPAYRQKMRNQTNMRVLLSILAVFVALRAAWP